MSTPRDKADRFWRRVGLSWFGDPTFRISPEAEAVWRALVTEVATSSGEIITDENWSDVLEDTITDFKSTYMDWYKRGQPEYDNPLLVLEETARGDVSATFALRHYWHLPLLEGPASLLRELGRHERRSEIGEE